MWVAIHQPNFMPWLGYFHKMASVDHFVLLDDVQFPKNGMCNRVTIKNERGEAEWATVPVHLPNGLMTHISEVAAANHQSWASKLGRKIVQNYRRAPYFSTYWPSIEGVLEAPPHRLAELNYQLLRLFMKWLEIKTELSWASHHAVTGVSNERIIQLVQSVGGTGYLSGNGARSYNDPAAYAAASIALAYQQFPQPEYVQLHGNWLPGCSVMDALFNLGQGAAELLHSLAAEQRERLKHV